MAAVDEDEAIIIVCPRCSAEQEDYDGFGVMWCEACLYCAQLDCKHPLCVALDNASQR